MILHQAIRITGVANQTIYDSGLQSTEKVPKKLLSILAQVVNEDQSDMDNNIQGWIEKAKIFDIPQELIDSRDLTSAADDQPLSAQRINEIPVDVDLAVGELFQAAVICGAKYTHFIGAYVYEVKG